MGDDSQKGFLYHKNSSCQLLKKALKVFQEGTTQTQITPTALAL